MLANSIQTVSCSGSNQTCSHQVRRVFGKGLKTYGLEKRRAEAMPRRQICQGMDACERLKEELHGQRTVCQPQAICHRRRELLTIFAHCSFCRTSSDFSGYLSSEKAFSIFSTTAPGTSPFYPRISTLSLLLLLKEAQGHQASLCLLLAISIPPKVWFRAL